MSTEIIVGMDGSKVQRATQKEEDEKKRVQRAAKREDEDRKPVQRS